MILITGSRDFKNLKVVGMFLHQFIADNGLGVELYVGDARGVDTVAATIWKSFGLKPKVYFADWKNEGKPAGILRNIRMVDEYVRDGGRFVMGFWDGKSRGTRHCLEYAQVHHCSVEWFDEAGHRHVGVG